MTSAEPDGNAMKRTPRMVVLALDGTDPESIGRCVDAGWLPEMAKVIRKARRVELQTLGDLFVPSPWPCAVSGVAVENHGIHAFRPIRSGTLDIIEGMQRHVPMPFREMAVRAGLRADVLDAPICAPPPKMPRSAACALWSGARIPRAGARFVSAIPDLDNE